MKLGMNVMPLEANPLLCTIDNTNMATMHTSEVEATLVAFNVGYRNVA
jgi:hypothetical protein